MFHLFSDIFTYRDNFLARIDPRAKLAVALVSIICVILSTRVILPLVVLALCTSGMLAVRMPARLILARLAVPMSIVLAVLVLQSLMTGSTPLFAVPIGSWRLILMREGLFQGVLIGCRVLSAVSVMLLLGSVTPAHRIFSSLLWLRVSRGWVEIAMLMYRYTFILLEHVSDAAAAQRLRLGYLGVRRSLSSIGTLAGSVIVRSFDQAARTHEAMTMRGYKGRMPFGSMHSMAGRDRRIAGLGSLGVVLAYLLLERRLF